ncbi:MAG: Bax inhibitor-1/YccA family protein [Candidatus Muirbacterium halophilum]|nr:Bax inhibitor-1/YccA family protein [Candidatus Muirbacterium halophilum]MCK9477444.1 Bax inhibitor-1/YccA family protein [Candidatus Muirbacterium halophilum]
MFGSSNPVFSQSLLKGHTNYENTLSVRGTFNKALILFALLISTAFYSWYYFFNNGIFNSSYITISAIAGFIVSLIIIFKPNTAPFLAPVYAVIEGFFISYISLYFNSFYPGIITQASLMTFAVVGIIITGYSLGIFKVSPSFIKGVQVATGALCLVYLLNFLFSFFGMPFAFLFSSSPLGILISVVIVIIASANILTNVHFIFQSEKHGLSKNMEWYLAFGLMVAVIWLYLEILRLFSKLQDRN